MFEQVLKKHSNALLILAGTGTYDVVGQEHGEDATHGIPTAALSIKKQLEKLPPHTFIEIPFEEDLFALYRLYDILVHVPIAHQKEAFGQVFIETMLSKVPSVITRTAVATDYAIHRENAWVVDFKNSEQIAEGIIQLLENKKLREKIIDNAFQIATEYTVEQKTKALEQLYEESYQRNYSK